jgi:hypothetical protein
VRVESEHGRDDGVRRHERNPERERPDDVPQTIGVGRNRSACLLTN